MKDPHDNVTPAWSRRCRELAGLLIPPLRYVARRSGYALAQHGSQARDIDLVAVPWSVPAIAPAELAERLRVAAEAIVGQALLIDKAGADNPGYFDAGCPGAKPHGRLAWSFHLGDGPYIDLSVVPPTEPPPQPE